MTMPRLHQVRLAVFALTCMLAVPLRAQHSVAPPSGAPSPVLTSDQLRADLAAFRSEFLGRDKSFAPVARTEAERRLAALEAETELSLVHVDVTLAQIAALADNGHTHTAAGGLAARHNRVPVRFAPFGGEFRVLRAMTPHATLLGARLVAVEGHALDALREAARSITGGTAAWRDRFANVVFESPALLHELRLAASPREATYRLELADGRQIDVSLVGEAGRADSPVGSTDRWLAPTMLAAEGDAWRTLLVAGTEPWALQDPARPFRWRMAPEIGGVVLQLRMTTDAPTEKLRDALAAMREAIVAAHPVNVVLDMRHNGGGDLNKARDFMKALPGLVTGRVFVLTSPWTFSAAISSVGYLKQAAPDKVVIVGEDVGDRLMFWAEGRPVTLPNSGVRIGLATQRHDYQTGCKGFTDCHGNVVFFPIAVPSLAPQIAAPWTFQAYAAGRDAGMEAVIGAVAVTP